MLFVVLLLGGFAAALYFIAQPQSLDDVSDYRLSRSDRSRDLQQVMKNAIERGYPVTIGEAEINRYIRRTLKSRQGGDLAKWVSIEGVAVRLEDGRAEIVIERMIKKKYPLTVSMYLNIVQTEDAEGTVKTALNLHGGPFMEDVPRLNQGGRFGQLVVPQGFLVLVLDSFRKIAKAYEIELNLAFEQMTRIRIEENKLILDPRLPGSSMGMGDF